MQKVEVQGLSFDGEGGVDISFFLPSDLKAGGVLQLRNLIIAGKGEYDDEIDAVLQAAQYLINDVLEDFDALPVADLRSPEPLAGGSSEE